MKIITVRQPWAWAIMHGGKDVENRSRNIVGSYRGPVAIHVSQTIVPAGDAWWVAAKAGMDTTCPKEDLDLGHIIGVVDIASVHHDSDHGRNEVDRCSPWAMTDHWHIRLAGPRPFATPIPAKGRLGLWWPDDELLTTIHEAATANPPREELDMNTADIEAES